MILPSPKHSIYRFMRKVRRFGETGEGSVAIIFGITFPVIIMAVGMAIDFSRALNVKAAVANALDSATLAAARQIADGESVDAAKEFARRYFDSNLLSIGVPGVRIKSFDLSANVVTGNVEVDAQATLPTSFMQIAGYEVLTVGVQSAALYATRPVEMSLMLDTTGSMAGSKIADLREAAEEVVDTLLPEGRRRDGKVRISLVPYSSAVNAGDYAEEVTGRRSHNTCVTERGGRHAFRDSAPHVQPLRQDTASCPSMSVEPLTDSRDRLIGTIRSLPARGSTAGHLGISWSWYTLSPKWSGIWPTGSRPVSHGDKGTVKVAILMTDGQFNTSFVGRNGNSSAQARELCDNMKDDGIIVYSVAFQAPRSAERLLQACATDDDTHYFDADNGEELIAAFRTIASGVQELRLTR